MTSFIELKLSPIKITEQAQRLIKQILDTQQRDMNTSNLVLRYYVFTGEEKIEAKLSLDTKINEDDSVIQFNGFKVVIDLLSLSYLRGSLIDVNEKNELVIHNFDPSAFLAGESCGSCSGGAGCCTL